MQNVVLRVVAEEQNLQDELSELSLGFLELVSGLIRCKGTIMTLFPVVKECVEYSGEIAPQIFTFMYVQVSAY